MKQIKTYLLFLSILSNLGCSSTVLVSINEYEPQTLKDYNPSEIFIITNDSIKYHFKCEEYYYKKNNALYVKGKIKVYEYKQGGKVETVRMVPTEGKIPLRDIKSIEEIAPNKINVITTKNEEQQFENKGYYYIENDTLYGQGEIYSNEVKKYYEGKIALSDIASVHTALMYIRRTSNKFKYLQPLENYTIDYNDYRDNKEGAEVTLILKFGEKIQGELLSVRDTALIIKYSPTEEELAEGVYPIISIKSEEIQKIIIEGESNFWEGAGYGAIAGAALGAMIGSASGDDPPGLFSMTKEEKTLTGVTCLTPIGAIIGGIAGSSNSIDEVAINLPPGYDFSLLNMNLGTSLNSLLKQLSRYPEKEPKYLKAIK